MPGHPEEPSVDTRQLDQRVLISTRSLDAEVEQFEQQNKDLLEAMRLFDMSQAAYERALLSLADYPVTTGTTTEPPVS